MGTVGIWLRREFALLGVVAVEVERESKGVIVDGDCCIALATIVAPASM